MVDGALCPRCGHRTVTTSGANDHAWYCHDCRMEFEDVDDGDVGYGPPDRRLRREERRGRYPSLDEGD
ncbi:MAG: hypothetical protein JW741_29310 [Sedimentisphaerales bacterium]|nr:hypothetical protein [Sedimentisphaerales bacterium]